MTNDILSTGRRPARRVVMWGLIRALLSVAVLTFLYFLGPLQELRVVPLGVSLALAGTLILGLSAWEVRAIARSRYPLLRATEALALTVPLYLLAFASAYYVMAFDDPSNFNVDELTRLDTLYFTVTTFASVGFGDISAVSQSARLLVTVQMIVNLLVLGAGIRVFVGAVRRGRDVTTPAPPTVIGPES